MENFYVDTLSRLIQRGIMRPEHSVLVTCGGGVDREAFQAAGLSNVTISNLDTDSDANQCAPYAWSRQDAERLSYGDGSFDFVVAHSGLHHCHSPHRALLEMYRVARKGVLVFEPRDGVLVRLGAKLGLGQEHELAAVFAHNSKAGGVANTAIPNYVYRWTAREVEKTINSFAPHARHQFEFYPVLRIPWRTLAIHRNKLWSLVVKLAQPVLVSLSYAFPCFTNNIGFLVLKPALPQDLQPWLKLDGDRVIVAPERLQERFVYTDGMSNKDSRPK